MGWNTECSATLCGAGSQDIQMCLGLFAGIGLATGDHDVGPSTNQAFGNGPTDTPGSSGNDGGAAGEIKQVVEFLHVHGPKLTGSAEAWGANW